MVPPPSSLHPGSRHTARAAGKPSPPGAGTRGRRAGRAADRRARAPNRGRHPPARAGSPGARGSLLAATSPHGPPKPSSLERLEPRAGRRRAERRTSSGPSEASWLRMSAPQGAKADMLSEGKAGPDGTPLVVHCKRARYDVYIGRPSKWGNPFQIGRDGTSGQAIARYERWLQTQPELLAALPSSPARRSGAGVPRRPATARCSRGSQMRR